MQPRKQFWVRKKIVKNVKSSTFKIALARHLMFNFMIQLHFYFICNVARFIQLNKYIVCFINRTWCIKLFIFCFHQFAKRKLSMRKKIKYFKVDWWKFLPFTFHTVVFLAWRKAHINIISRNIISYHKYLSCCSDHICNNISYFFLNIDIYMYIYIQRREKMLLRFLFLLLWIWFLFFFPISFNQEI